MDAKDKKILELERQVAEAQEQVETLATQYSQVAEAQREVSEQLKEYILELEAEMDKKEIQHSEAIKAAEQSKLELQNAYAAIAKELQSQFQTIAMELEKESSQHQETKNQLRNLEVQNARIKEEKLSLQASEGVLQARLESEIQAHSKTKVSLQEVASLWQAHEQRTRSESSMEKESLMILESQAKELKNSFQAEKLKCEALTKELEASKMEFLRMKARVDQEIEKSSELSKFKDEVLKKRETHRITMQAKRPTTNLEPPNLPLPKAPGNRNTLMPMPGNLPRNSMLDPNKRKTILEKRRTIMEQNNNIIGRIEEITTEMVEIEKELTEADQRTIILETALTFTENQRKEGEKYFKQLSTAMNALLKKMDSLIQGYASFSSGSTTLEGFKLIFNREAPGLRSVLQVVQEDVAKQLIKVSELPTAAPVAPAPKAPFLPIPEVPSKAHQNDAPQPRNPVFDVLHQIRSGSFSLKKVTEVDKTKMRRDIRRSKAVLVDLQETLREALMNHRLDMLEDDDNFEDLDDGEW